MHRTQDLLSIMHHPWFCYPLTSWCEPHCHSPTELVSVWQNEECVVYSIEESTHDWTRSVDVIEKSRKGSASTYTANGNKCLFCWSFPCVPCAIVVKKFYHKDTKDTKNFTKKKQPICPRLWYSIRGRLCCLLDNNFGSRSIFSRPRKLGRPLGTLVWKNEKNFGLFATLQTQN